jgi:predicted metal-dependent hydrolase
VRDSKKRKFYLSENFLKDIKEYSLTEEEVIEFGNKVLDDKWFKKYIPPRMGTPWLRRFHRIQEIDYRFAKKGKVARGTLCYDRRYDVYYAYLELPPWALHKYVILHEIAHALQTENPTHGRQYARIVLGLVRHFLGKDMMIKLRNSFKENGIKYCKKKKLTRTL